MIKLLFLIGFTAFCWLVPSVGIPLATFVCIVCFWETIGGGRNADR